MRRSDTFPQLGGEWISFSPAVSNDTIYWQQIYKRCRFIACYFNAIKQKRSLLKKNVMKQLPAVRLYEPATVTQIPTESKT